MRVYGECSYRVVRVRDICMAVSGSVTSVLVVSK